MRLSFYLPRRGRGTAEAVDEGNRRRYYVRTNYNDEHISIKIFKRNFY